MKSLIVKVMNLPKTVSVAIDKDRRRRQTYNALMKLTNKELHDIGINRGDILRIADGGAVYTGRTNL
jgi:uncharacterized protein YjiS (DUF1127 family)